MTLPDTILDSHAAADVVPNVDMAKARNRGIDALRRYQRQLNMRGPPKRADANLRRF